MDYRTDPTVIETINANLLRDWRVLDGRPIYRIVWSDTQLEMRRGKYSEFYGDHIFIREVEEVREVKKYWYYIKPCWVFEKLIFAPSSAALKDIQHELVNYR